MDLRARARGLRAFLAKAPEFEAEADRLEAELEKAAAAEVGRLPYTGPPITFE
jgi:hypothetical protein